MNEIKMSPEIGKLAEALAAAQIEFKPVFKESDNPYYSSKYADLSSVIAATQPSLAKNGLVVMQSPIFELADQKAGISTLLAHASGQWISNELLLPATMKAKDGALKFDAQSVGSALTYARRYAYQAIVGVAAELDDDGNAATGNGHGSVQQAQSVADRKIQEYKAKQGDFNPNAAKTDQISPTGEETIILAPYKEGWIGLSGNGLPIVRSCMTDAEKDDFKITLHDGNVWAVTVANSFRFADLCSRYKVGTVFMDAQPSSAPKEGGTQANGGGNHTGASPLPIIKGVFAKSGHRNATKERPAADWEMRQVIWGDTKLVCWNKGLWPYLEAGKGKPAALQITKSFDGKKDATIDGITRIGDTEYEVIEGKTVPVIKREATHASLSWKQPLHHSGNRRIHTAPEESEET